MSDEEATGTEAGGAEAGGAEAADDADKKSTRKKMGEGIKQGIGFLSAFKDALEETIQEARDRGDLSADRAKEVMKDALGRAQAAASEARERLDFASQAEFDALLERVGALEEEVFGERRANAGAADEEAAAEEDAKA